MNRKLVVRAFMALMLALYVANLVSTTIHDAHPTGRTPAFNAASAALPPGFHKPGQPPN